ncbi:glutamate racemase [Salinactinospora qingdaonensis]|uniref:Aspartate/glutamate racemase family protein n=1 Tax=Salinactinospora qingdaonensis TaxID=702744 RepID=A0ABP7EU31_9ACTN
MRIALIDSGLGLLSTAAALRAARPDADLILSMDPQHMPWGPRSPEEITRRALAGARAALATEQGSHGVDALVVACNSASVHALPTLRAHLEPTVPVVGTVPAIKPAADGGGPVAIWATPATTDSPYQRDLIARFARGAQVAPVACEGLAGAVESGDTAAVAAAIATAAERTPPDVAAVVLGCTHYDLVSEPITAALGEGVELFTAATAVAAQTLRRLQVQRRPDASPTGRLTVLSSGHPGELPAPALTYPAGAFLAQTPRAHPAPVYGPR